MKVEVTQLCLILCGRMNCSLPASSVHGILQARILEWVAYPFSSGSFRPRNQTGLLHWWWTLYQLSWGLIRKILKSFSASQTTMLHLPSRSLLKLFTLKQSHLLLPTFNLSLDYSEIFITDAWSIKWFSCERTSSLLATRVFFMGKSHTLRVTSRGLLRGSLESEWASTWMVSGLPIRRTRGVTRMCSGSAWVTRIPRRRRSNPRPQGTSMAVGGRCVSSCPPQRWSVSTVYYNQQIVLGCWLDSGHCARCWEHSKMENSLCPWGIR